MSQASPTPAAVTAADAVRPRFFDYLLILIGMALSAVLADWSGVRVTRESAATFQQAFLNNAPFLVLLPVGVVLFWPVFHLTQRLLGRKTELTWGEWLWGLAWLEAVFLVVWIVWKGIGSPPEALTTPDFRKGVLLGHVIFAVSTGGLAIILFLATLFRGRTVPWTHTFSLALLMWPLLPLALWWSLGEAAEVV